MKGEIKADEIWKIYNDSPRLPQVCLDISYSKSVSLIKHVNCDCWKEKKGHELKLSVRS